MKYLIGAAITLALLALPVIATEQGRATTSCIIKSSYDPQFDALEWEWCVWAMHDLDNTHHEADQIQFRLKTLLEEKGQ